MLNPRLRNITLPATPPRTVEGMAAALLAAKSGAEIGACGLALNYDAQARMEWDTVAAMVLSWLPPGDA